MRDSLGEIKRSEDSGKMTRRKFLKNAGIVAAGTAVGIGIVVGERMLNELADFLYSEPPEAGRFYPGGWDWIDVDCIAFPGMTMQESARRKIFDVAQEMTGLPKKAYAEDGGWKFEYMDPGSWDIEIGERNNYNFRNDDGKCSLEIPRPYLKGK